MKIMTKLVELTETQIKLFAIIIKIKANIQINILIKNQKNSNSFGNFYTYN